MGDDAVREARLGGPAPEHVEHRLRRVDHVDLVLRLGEGKGHPAGGATDVQHRPPESMSRCTPEG
jgi:hypothetical protein